jgi:hypothetical protein
MVSGLQLQAGYRKGDIMPKKIMYPCQYPDCPARFDETLAGTTDDQPGVNTGWIYPHDAEKRGDVGTHDHILNAMHKVEVDNGN